MRFDLEERTLKFAKKVIRLCMSLPRNPINDRLVGQLIGATSSIGANYREANDALGKKDFAMRMRIARRETKECHYFLELICEANPTCHAEIQPLLIEAQELRNIFSAIIDKTERK